MKVKGSETQIDFESLAQISTWTQLCWEQAWETLAGYEKPIENLDEVWAFLVRVVFKSRIPPTDVADVILEIFDEGDGSQFIQRL